MKDEPIIQERPKRRRKSGRNRNINLIIFVLIFLVLIVAIPYYLFLPKEEKIKLQQYEQGEVTVRDFVKTVSASGTVVASEKSVIKSEIAGTVISVLCQPGDMVDKGDLLFELDSGKLKEDLRKAEADCQKKIKEQRQLTLDHQRQLKQYDEDIQSAEEEYEKLKEQYPTWEELYELGEISLVQLEAEKAKVSEALDKIIGLKENKEYAIEKYKLDQEGLTEMIEEAEKNIEEIKKSLASSKIFADITGKVVSVPVELGDSLQIGTNVAEIIDEESLIVEGEVSQNVIDAVAVGQRVDINVGNNQYAGKVTFIAAVAKESRISIKVTFDQVPEELRPQTSVGLDIQVGVFKDCLALPRGRYLSSGMERYVYRIDGNKAYKTEVSFGLINGNFVEVRTGLSKGDLVITGSYDSFIHLNEIDINPEGGVER